MNKEMIENYIFADSVILIVLISIIASVHMMGVDYPLANICLIMCLAGVLLSAYLIFENIVKLKKMSCDEK